MINSMDQLAVMGFISVIGMLIAIISGWLTIRKNLRDYTKDVVSWQVQLEHRLTEVETNVKWIKDNLPRRKGDQHDP